MVKDDSLIFKSYSRALLRSLNALKSALNSKDYEHAEKIVNGLICDTQENIEGAE